MFSIFVCVFYFIFLRFRGNVEISICEHPLVFKTHTCFCNYEKDEWPLNCRCSWVIILIALIYWILFCTPAVLPDIFMVHKSRAYKTLWSQDHNESSIMRKQKKKKNTGLHHEMYILIVQTQSLTDAHYTNHCFMCSENGWRSLLFGNISCLECTNAWTALLLLPLVFWWEEKIKTVKTN